MIDTIWTLKQIFGILLVATGILDGWKYGLQGNKIRHNKSAKGMSRMFMNFALSQDITKLIYGIIIKDIYIIIISIVALVFMSYMWEQIRIYYPYKTRGLSNFHRPNILIYIWNSLLPNKIRRRL